MARDDYFVIVYKILIYLYECLKKGKTPDTYNIITAESYGIVESYFEYIISEMLNSGYIRGVSVFNAVGKNTPYIKITESLTITPKGIEYLQNNSTIARIKTFLKEIKETVPGL